MAATATAARAVSQREDHEASSSLFALFLPAAVLLFLFNYLPIYGIIISFKDFTPYRGILGSAWAGLDHFRFFLSDARFWNVVKNTIYISLLRRTDRIPRSHRVRAAGQRAREQTVQAGEPDRLVPASLRLMGRRVRHHVPAPVPLHGMLNKLVVLFGARTPSPTSWGGQICSGRSSSSWRSGRTWDGGPSSISRR